MRLNALQLQEMNELQKETSPTKRATVPAIEALLYDIIPILNHGFIRVIDYMGDDSAVVQAARVSYGKGTKKTNEDQGLINYLMRHRHSTPFEMCELKLHVKLPIFVARQWIRHRTANINEYSARYSILDNEFYVPEPQHLAAQSTSNRQGRETVLQGEDAHRVLDLLRQDALTAYRHYQELLNEDENGAPLVEGRSGLARELARMNLPVNFYTQWYWKIDLHNLMHFLSLRADHHAQYEIQTYADAILDIMKKWVPLTHDAFLNYRRGAVTLSARAFEVVQDMIKGRKVSHEDSGLSMREYKELMSIIKKDE